jgi:acyl-CoA synthetase (AMP-forming)/AMP-acid ligase II
MKRNHASPRPSHLPHKTFATNKRGDLIFCVFGAVALLLAWAPVAGNATWAHGSACRFVMNGPMYHSAPAAYGVSSAQLGLSIVLQPRFDAEDMLRLIDKHRVSHTHIVPTMFVQLLRLVAEVEKKYDLSSALRKSR